MTQQTVRAIYEDGVLKPLESVNLPDQQVVELRISVTSDQRQVIRLGGSWSSYLTGEAPTFEDIQELTHTTQAQSLRRLLDQVNGKFDDSLTP